MAERFGGDTQFPRKRCFTPGGDVTVAERFGGDAQSRARVVVFTKPVTVANGFGGDTQLEALPVLLSLRT